MEAVFGIIILILSVVIHEVSHGYAAYRLGDPTAKLAGRLTLNPIKHLDLFGSFIVPVLTFFGAGFIFGWAKPVPYNPYNLKHHRGDAIVAFAGPLSNILLALVFGLAIRIGLSVDIMSQALLDLFSLIVLINIVLAIFNLIPVPPLDGSKILFSFLPYQHNHIRVWLERYGMVLILLVVFFAWRLIFPLVVFFFTLFTGIPF